MCTWSLTGGQVLLPVVVSVSVTPPLATSLALGLYCGFNPPPVNEPRPPLHVPPVALVTLPLNCTGSASMHAIWSGPAFAWLGWPVALIVIVPVAGAHPFTSVTLTV